MGERAERKLLDYELRHRALARRAAAEGIVLLKNEGILPLAAGQSLALYGAGAVGTVKGGSGSGDVNARESVNIWQGLKNAGFSIENEDWLFDYERRFQEARLSWRDRILSEFEEGNGNDAEFFEIYTKNPFRSPSGGRIVKTEADCAVYVLSRTAGEGKDRRKEPGDYFLSKEEERELSELSELYRDLILLLNTGGPVDLSFTERLPNIRAILFLSQPGMEGGNAVSDILSGAVSPSGRLTDSWALRYEDYPNAESFSYLSGDLSREEYKEGIYVGYRYFDSFSVPLRYGFGEGLSYTDFSIRLESLRFLEGEAESALSYGSTLLSGLGLQSGDQGDRREQAESAGVEPALELSIRVENTGSRYAGRECVQIYASLPAGELEKEHRRLIGFRKTALLSPGESEEFLLRIPIYLLASYEEKRSAYLLERGCYGIWIGGSLRASKAVWKLRLEKEAVLLKLRPELSIREELSEIKRSREMQEKLCAAWEELSLPETELPAEKLCLRELSYRGEGPLPGRRAAEIAAGLSEEELLHLVTGRIREQDGKEAFSQSVPGAAGETIALDTAFGRLEPMVLADGPAGLRLEAEPREKDGRLLSGGLISALECGFFRKTGERDPAERIVYQYCTAFPVGTLLAQSFDPRLLREIGEAVSEEMELFHIAIWLAPGINIHRNPLCGRNFEYYSEDPLLSGVMAASLSLGVQERKGHFVAIKHLAGNNQEDNRMGSDDIVSERALREIYLRGFELAVKNAAPGAIMSSYNLINGVHSANNRALCTEIARKEWGFRGLIMSDWGTTNTSTDAALCTASGCIRAGNDLIMPGAPEDLENMREALRKGELSLELLRLSASRILEAAGKTETGAEAVQAEGRKGGERR